MRVAVLSDIHANFPALERVLEAIRDERPDGVVCLGDTVGYNAHPRECIEALRAVVDCAVAGNHDRDVFEPRPVAGTRSEARRVQCWTRDALEVTHLDYLRSLPNIATWQGMTLAHGCYLNDWHYTGYVTSTMLERNLAAVAHRPEWGPIALCGHTHVPMCGFLRADGVTECVVDGPVFWPADAKAVLINPGSVGQPRDGDPRAAFSLVDLTRRMLAIRRVAYDIEATTTPMRNSGFPQYLIDRLWDGQ